MMLKTTSPLLKEFQKFTNKFKIEEGKSADDW